MVKIGINIEGQFYVFNEKSALFFPLLQHFISEKSSDVASCQNCGQMTSVHKCTGTFAL
jgi:hypothetical protein